VGGVKSTSRRDGKTAKAKEVTTSVYPELTDSAIEAAATSLIATFEASTGEVVSVPIPVERIAENFLGYRVEVTDQGLFADPDYLGGIDFENKTILVNASVEDHDGRYAFTIAHELGHHVLHRNHFLNDAESRSNGIMCRSKTKRPMIEHQADRFAAALLMPAASLEHAARGLSRQIRGPRKFQRLAARLITDGGFTNVSNEAMRYRMRELGIGMSPLGLPRALYNVSVWGLRLLKRISRD
jgi:hypothetical protein